MNRQRVAAIARRVAQQVRRDRRSLALLIIAPIAVLALLGFVIRDEKPIETRLGIVALGGAAEAPVTSALSAAAAQAGVSVVDAGTDAASARAAVQAGRADVVIVLPADLSSGNAGGPTTVQLITLGEAPIDDGARLQVVAGLLQRAASQGGSALTIEHDTIYGSPTADVLDTFAPGLIGFFGFFFVFVLTGISFLRERTGGTLERLLATPVRRSEIVIGYSLGFGLFATIQVVLILLFTLSAVDDSGHRSAGQLHGWPGHRQRRQPAPRLPGPVPDRDRGGQPGDLPLDVRPDGAPGPRVHPDRDRPPGISRRPPLVGQ